MGKKKEKKSKKEKKQEILTEEMPAEKEEKEDETVMRAEDIPKNPDETETIDDASAEWKIKNSESENEPDSEKDTSSTEQKSEEPFSETSGSQTYPDFSVPTAGEAWKYASGIVSILLSLVLALDAWIVVSEIYGNGFSVLGQSYISLMSAMFSAFMAVLMMITGIISIATRKNEGYSSDVPVLILSACAAVTGFTGTIVSEEKFLLLAMWCAVVSIVSMAMLLIKRRQKQSVKFWPIALIICFATLLFASFGETYLIRTETQISSLRISGTSGDILEGIFGNSYDDEEDSPSGNFRRPGQSHQGSQNQRNGQESEHPDSNNEESEENEPQTLPFFQEDEIQGL